MNIVLFSTADWNNPFWTNKQHMSKVFLKHGHKVIYVDSLGIRKPKASQKDFLRILKRFKSLFKPYTKIEDGLWVVSPFIIPFHNIAIIKLFNRLFLSFVVRTLMFFLNFKKRIIWTYSPVTDDLVDTFNAKYVVYHCVDDLSALPNVDKDLLKQREKNLIMKSDYVFTTSLNLYNHIKPLNSNTYYQNNVCDYEHFSKARSDNYELPKDLQDIKKPIVIFIGAISAYKINFELLSNIAQRQKEWAFVLIGEVGEGQPETKIDLISKHENIHLLGAKKYAELPQYLHFSDVAILPSNINDYTKSMFPMKFFEYLSAGLQVVATNLDSLQEYENLCYLSKNELEFENNIKLVLQNNRRSQDDIDKECQKQTWDTRYMKMMQILGSDDY